MSCHATGTEPSRQYPRKNFIAFLTPLGVLWFRDEQTARQWHEGLPQHVRDFMAENSNHTPGAIVAGSQETSDVDR